jgi:hypothetical protein
VNIGLSKPSKMPGHAYSLPAKNCLLGAKLRIIRGSVCEKCYAMKGRYNFPNVKKAMLRRLEAIKLEGWVEVMVTLIVKSKDRFFRWHDSGDIQSIEHLGKIIEIAKRLPKVSFWLPTKEYGMIDEFMKTNEIPPNIVLRISAPMMDRDMESGRYENTSSVSKTVKLRGYECPAPQNGGKCGDCRACWDRKIENVVYHAH